MSQEQSEFVVAHLTTVDMSLRYLVAPQMLAVLDVGGKALGISGPGRWVPEIEAMGVTHIPLGSSTRGANLVLDVKAAYELWKVLRSEHITVLHTHNPKPGLYGRILGRLAGVPLVVNTVHGLYATSDDPLLKRMIVYFLEAIASRFSHVELYQNPEDLHLAVEKRIVARDKAAFLGNGVDLGRFAPGRADPERVAALREEIGAGTDSVVVGTVGRLVEEKGFPELFEAMDGLEGGHILVVVGPEDLDKSDSLSSESVARARERGVRFLGMREDMVDIYAAMDLFVLPSHREGFPRAAMEAAAMGLPVVATDIRGCRQVVADGDNGFLVPVRDPAALRMAIGDLGADPALRARMGQRSRERSRVEFDEREVVRIVMESYLRGLRQRGLGHLTSSDMASSLPTKIRSAAIGDAAAIANLHVDGISTGFLPRLGRRFMKVLYEAMIEWPGAVVLVAADESGPAGFVAGVSDISGFYRHFARTHWLRGGLAALPSLLRISVMKRALETFRYGQDEPGVVAELVSMAVAPRARRRGLASSLGRGLLETMDSEEIRVVVAADNAAAISAYIKMGFVPDHEIEVHEGERSEVLVWRR